MSVTPERRTQLREACRRYYVRNQAAMRERARRRRVAVGHAAADPVKARARKTLRNAVRAGRVVKPECCSACGDAAVLQAHHEDYSQPLVVEWLCVPCHGGRHRL